MAGMKRAAHPSKRMSYLLDQGTIFARCIGFQLLWSVLISGYLFVPTFAAPPCVQVSYGFVSLFDGDSLRGWTDRDGKATGSAWNVEDGAIHLDPAKGAGGDIVTVNIWVEFELEFEWKIEAGGNSGLKYWVQLGSEKMSAIEYQLLDETEHQQSGNGAHATADMYDLFPANEALRSVRPAGEYNHSRIVATNKRLQHWLNGTKVIDVCLNHPAWPAAVRKSKFNDVPGYAYNRGGKFLLQDHGAKVWFRNLHVRPR